MLSSYTDHSNIKKIENLIDKNCGERKILDNIKEYRYKEISQKLLNKLTNNFLKNDENTYEYTYHHDWYDGSPYKSFMDFFIRKLTTKKEKELSEKSKKFNMIIPNESYVESIGNFKDTSKILRLKKTSKNTLSDLKKFDIDVSDYNYIDMKLLVTFYHRVHSPVNGIIKKLIPIDGKDNFFGNNSLWIVEFETKKHPVYLLLIGESVIQDFNFFVEKNNKLDIFQSLGFFNWGSQTIILYNSKDYNDILIEEGKTYFVGDGIFK